METQGLVKSSLVEVVEVRGGGTCAGGGGFVLSLLFSQVSEGVEAPVEGALVPGFVAGDSVESGEKAEVVEGGAVEEVGFGLLEAENVPGFDDDLKNQAVLDGADGAEGGLEVAEELVT